VRGKKRRRERRKRKGWIAVVQMRATSNIWVSRLSPGTFSSSFGELYMKENDDDEVERKKGSEQDQKQRHCVALRRWKMVESLSELKRVSCSVVSKRKKKG